jgi:hypothetical protein
MPDDYERSCMRKRADRGVGICGDVGAPIFDRQIDDNRFVPTRP